MVEQGPSLWQLALISGPAFSLLGLRTTGLIKDLPSKKSKYLQVFCPFQNVMLLNHTLCRLFSLSLSNMHLSFFHVSSWIDTLLLLVLNNTLALICNLISLYSEILLCMNWLLLDLFWLSRCAKIWPILINTPYAFGKNVHSFSWCC